MNSAQRQAAPRGWSFILAGLLLTGVALGAAPSSGNGAKLNMQPGPNAPRTLDVPRRLTEIRRDLRIGQLWVAQNNDRPTALRISLEYGNRIVAAVTVDPDNGKPVPFQDRGNYRPLSAPVETTLGTYLRDLRQDTQNMRFGAYVLPSPRGYEVQVYWGGKLVSYLYVNPNNGDASTDETATKELAASMMRVR